MRLDSHERFILDLEDCGRSWCVVLDESVARELLQICHRKRQKCGYKTARNEALEDALLASKFETEDQWNAYKDFIDLRFLRRAHAANRVKFRPFAPPEAV